MRIVAGVVSLALVAAHTAAGQTRAIGMANVATWLRDDDVLFFNPAQLAVARGTSVSGETRSTRDRDGALSSVLAFGKGGVGVGMTLAQQRMPQFFNTPNGMVPGPDIPVTGTLVAAGIGQTFNGRRVGLSAKYAASQFGDNRLERGLVDAGISQDFKRYFTASVVARDIPLNHTAWGAHEYNTVVGLAASFPAGPFDVVTASDGSFSRSGSFEGAFGAEASWSWLSGYSVAARTGIFGGDLHGINAGLGFTRDRVSIDYAFDQRAAGHTGHRLGLRVR